MRRGAAARLQQSAAMDIGDQARERRRKVSKIIICGGGMIGLCAATMLARDGHDVTILEADTERVPAASAEAWEAWKRPGVSQVRQPHNLFARFRLVSDYAFPDPTVP